MTPDLKTIAKEDVHKSRITKPEAWHIAVLGLKLFLIYRKFKTETIKKCTSKHPPSEDACAICHFNALFSN